MFGTYEWDLEAPKLILSITGGAKNFYVSQQLKDTLKQGLNKVVSLTNAWIISGGTNVGVMKLVGDAIEDQLLSSNIVVLGIASWNTIINRESIVRKCCLCMIVRTKNNLYLNLLLA